MRALTLGLALALSVCGCQKTLTEKDYVGTWTSKVTIDDAALEKQVKALGGTAAQVQQAKDMLKNVTVTLNLKQDKTYDLSQGMGSLEGTWVYKDLQLTMTPTKAMGMTKEEVLKQSPAAKAQFDPFTLASDKEGKVLTGTAPGSEGKAALSFTRTEKAASG